MVNENNQTETTKINEASKTNVSVKPSKDFWDKMSAIGSILLPISLAIVGYIVSSNLKNREINAEYFKLAVDILKNSEPNHSPDGMQLYAFNILKSLSPVPTPPALEASLVGRVLKKDRYTSGEGFGDECSIRLESTDYDPIYIYVDGELRAITPVTIEIPEGNHNIEFRTEAGKPICKENVTLNEQQRTNIKIDPKTQKTVVSTRKISHGASGSW
jgi:hypothetical protein